MYNIVGFCKAVEHKPQIYKATDSRYALQSCNVSLVYLNILTYPCNGGSILLVLEDMADNVPLLPPNILHGHHKNYILYIRQHHVLKIYQFYYAWRENNSEGVQNLRFFKRFVDLSSNVRRLCTISFLHLCVNTILF